MNPLQEDMESALTGSQSPHTSLRDVHSINPTHLMARIESYEGREKKGISDVRRTFCLFVTFDLLFVTLLWIIELNIISISLPGQTMSVLQIGKVNGGIENTLEKEVVQYDYYSSYFDIFLLAVFRFKVLILAYAVCRLRHWWAIALTTAVTSAFLLAKVILSKLFSQGAFGYVLPIISFLLAWIETWFLDFKVLPQEAEEENRLLIVQDASERAALIPGGLSDGQFYSPPESEAGSEEEAEEKQDSEKPLLEL
ncbi:STARD3 N-terminal-like protein isoform X1 [Callorhinus ursinus]|uniref:STARD3 N-terminal-like protein isoform X1 n=1 Tax=Callorhinus ursinus TaxID=34884 RepID=A0A3Q7PEB7_CALUR|nr:STARD3 N-terminal-like protein isoform X1 [Callorhinus ursinus]XP_025728491.1 STARD3 N-terminal-like protein isoform X1 [Callorhinus ursinus]XP_025728492.1 STARD3 N-terminal-like protein isoform X1 [Callorhinus ursinus]XP_027951126.1 STARD3 N-terminal-like protein isoform X1 [Eumetopias jubatus]XP_027951127.1 STARD3 N-terminal-like protein isoform X1 [Eumetopias jubatus]